MVRETSLAVTGALRPGGAGREPGPYRKKGPFLEVRAPGRPRHISGFRDIVRYTVAQFIDCQWVPQYEPTGLTRIQRRAGAYRAYVPDRLSNRRFLFEAGVAADVADAERDVARLDQRAQALGDTEALARILLRAESVASSHIEGLTTSAQRLLRADVSRAEGEALSDATAAEVLANVDAMAYAVAGAADVTLERIVEFHRRLLLPTRNAKHAGRIRTVQNWIGGSPFNPFGAAFVPPPPEKLPTLLRDLCRFCNDDGLPTIAQAAIAHAQFETLHPFAEATGEPDAR